MNELTVSVIGFMILGAILIGLIILCRELMCWYCKINESIKIQQNILLELQKINEGKEIKHRICNKD